MTIPFGWRLIIDESPPPLYMLVVEGAVTFDNASDITLTAAFVVVQRTGSLSAGTPGAPHPRLAQIRLSGGRQDPQLAINNNLVLGSKVMQRLCLHASRSWH